MAEKSGPKGVRRGLKDVWNGLVSAFRDLSKVDPRYAIYGLIASAVFLILERECRGTFRHKDTDLGTNAAQTHLWLVDRIWDTMALSPWLPAVLADEMLAAAGKLATGDETIPFLKFVLRKKLYGIYLATARDDPTDARYTLWHIPPIERLSLQILLAVAPFAVLESMGPILRGIGEIVPG